MIARVQSRTQGNRSDVYLARRLRIQPAGKVLRRAQTEPYRSNYGQTPPEAFPSSSAVTWSVPSRSVNSPWAGQVHSWKDHLPRHTVCRGTVFLGCLMLCPKCRVLGSLVQAGFPFPIPANFLFADDPRAPVPSAFRTFYGQGDETGRSSDGPVTGWKRWRCILLDPAAVRRGCGRTYWRGSRKHTGSRSHLGSASNFPGANPHQTLKRATPVRYDSAKHMPVSNVSLGVILLIWIGAGFCQPWFQISDDTQLRPDEVGRNARVITMIDDRLPKRSPSATAAFSRLAPMTRFDHWPAVPLR